MLRRDVWLHLQGDVAEARVQQHILAHLINGGVFERLDALRLDLDANDLDRRERALRRIYGDERNLINHLDAFGNLPEGRELAVELRLRPGADEELRAVAVRLARNARCRHRAANVFYITELVRQQVERAQAPLVARLGRVFEIRVAALNQTAREHAKEGRAIVKTFARPLDELLHMARRFVGQELEADDAHVGGDNGFEPGGFGERHLRVRLAALLLLRRLKRRDDRQQRGGDKKHGDRLPTLGTPREHRQSGSGLRAHKINLPMLVARSSPGKLRRAIAEARNLDARAVHHRGDAVTPR